MIHHFQQTQLFSLQEQLSLYLPKRQRRQAPLILSSNLTKKSDVIIPSAFCRDRELQNDLAARASPSP